MALATNSVPVPISPVIRTVQSVAARFGTYTRAGRSASDEPKMSSSSCELSMYCCRCKGSSRKLFEFRVCAPAALRFPCLCQKSLIQKSSAVCRHSCWLFACKDSYPCCPVEWFACYESIDSVPAECSEQFVRVSIDRVCLFIDLAVPRQTVCYPTNGRLL